MEPPISVVRSSIFNALFPSYAKNLFYALLILFPLLFLGMLFSMLGFLALTVKELVTLYVITGMAVACFPLIAMIITYLNTEYYFYSDRVVREFRFFVVHQHTVMYAKITNITLKVTLWDRICNAGDITLHTADDNDPDLRLEFIIGPERVQQQLYGLIQAAVRTPAGPGVSTLQSTLRAMPAQQNPSGPRPPKKTHIAPSMARR